MIATLAPLLGCWHRRSIRYATGVEDSATRVVWLQTVAGMADIRIAAGRPDLRARAGLADCTKEELLALAEQDAMCGMTLFEAEAQPHPTASWPASGNLLRFQPVTAFPEPGWLEWRDGGATMIERAPSSAYEEDWRLQPGSQAETSMVVRQSGASTECLYVAGHHAVYAHGRAVQLAERRRLPELAREAGDDLARLRGLVDCEFSYARRAAGGREYVIELSTLPWREGMSLGSMEGQIMGQMFGSTFLQGR